MFDSKETHVSSTPAMASNDNAAMDQEALKLAEMGYQQSLARNYSLISILGVGFSLTNSWFGISAALITGINSGGPVLLIYGLILICLISICVGVSLSELASAYPNAGGQYFWASELAPRLWADAASYATGWAAWAGSVFTSASVCLAVASAGVGCWQLSHPDFTIEAKHVVGAYEVINAFCFFFNCYGKVLPTMGHLALWTSLVSFFVILVAVPASAPSHQHARFVFANFVNNTGWSNNGIVGLINANYAFACLDCATHLAEEVHRPERMVPIAIMGTVFIGFCTAWPFAISMFFSISDLDSLFNTSTLVPTLALFYQALSNKAGAIVLEALIMATGIGCLVSSHTWQSRLCWSFARDRGVPFGKYLSHVEPRLGVPMRAHLLSCAIVGALGCLYLGSYTAFNSMVTACIVLLYISYAIPVTCLLLRGRNNIPHGPFWLRKFGLVANIVLLCWTLFTFVLYSLPVVMPVQAGNMNYISAVYGILALIMLVDWFVRGRRNYRGAGKRHLDSGELVREIGHGEVKM
ncbi:MAG: hypothetical protein Q9191_005831 [Dirinaria sp. TL-2023a]